MGLWWINAISQSYFQSYFTGNGKLLQFKWSNIALQWRPNECNGVSNHQPLDCLLNRLLRRNVKKTSKLRVTGLCLGNSPVTGESPAQRASNAENVSFDDVITILKDMVRTDLHRNSVYRVHISRDVLSTVFGQTWWSILVEMISIIEAMVSFSPWKRQIVNCKNISKK